MTDRAAERRRMVAFVPTADAGRVHEDSVLPIAEAQTISQPTRSR